MAETLPDIPEESDLDPILTRDEDPTQELLPEDEPPLDEASEEDDLGDAGKP